MLIEALFNNQEVKATQMSISRWMNKENGGIYVYTLLLLSHFSHVRLCATP